MNTNKLQTYFSHFLAFWGGAFWIFNAMIFGGLTAGAPLRVKKGKVKLVICQNLIFLGWHL